MMSPPSTAPSGRLSTVIKKEKTTIAETRVLSTAPCWLAAVLALRTRLTVSAVEATAEFGPGRPPGAAERSDTQGVVGVGAQVQRQVAAGVGSQPALMSVQPAAIQDHQLKLPAGGVHTRQSTRRMKCNCL